MSLVDLSGEYSIRYTPLAIMCLQAAIADDVELAERTSIVLNAFTQQFTIADMTETIVAQKPHVVGLSCEGNG